MNNMGSWESWGICTSTRVAMHEQVDGIHKMVLIFKFGWKNEWTFGGSMLGRLWHYARIVPMTLARPSKFFNGTPTPNQVFPAAITTASEHLSWPTSFPTSAKPDLQPDSPGKLALRKEHRMGECPCARPSKQQGKGDPKICGHGPSLVKATEHKNS